MMELSDTELGEEVIANIPVGAGVFDLVDDTVRLVYLNDGFYQMISACREDRSRYFGAGAVDPVHPDDRAGLFEEARASIGEGRMFRYRFRNLDGAGRYVWLEITASHKKLDEGAERFYAVYYDVDDYVRRQNEAKARYENSVEDILSTVPDAMGIARVDVTDDTCTWHSVPPTDPNKEIWPRRWNELVHFIASNATDKHALYKLERSRLLEAFNHGETHKSCDYQRLGQDGKPRWLTSHVSMLSNPETGHVEAIAYTVNRGEEVLRAEISQIITSRSLELVALIHLDTRDFEAVYLGDALPAVYRKLLPESGATCAFDDFCAESELHMVGKSRTDYESKLSSEYIRGELERNGGTYEFTVEERFEDKGPDSVFRRFQHYCLEYGLDTVLVIESDVTAEVLRQRKENAAALERAERDRMIMDSIMGAICILKMRDNGDLMVDYFNSYVFEMLGYDPAGLPHTADEAKGTPGEALFADAYSFIHPDDREYVRSMYLAHRDDSSFSLAPYRMFGSDGEVHWMKVKARRGGTKDGCRLFYVTMPDITQEKSLQTTLAKQVKEEQTLRAKADAASAAKSEFLSRMSHDIRTPLNGIIGMAYLSRRYDLPEQARENLAKIDTSAKFLLELINDVLDMAKVESGKHELHFEPYPIDEFNGYLDAVIKPLCDERGQHLDIVEDVDADAVPLIDRSCINKILFNLLSNAVKFTPEGGTISYSVQGTEMPSGRVAIVHRIKDDGIGMSDEFQKKLFTPFMQEGRDDVSDQRGSGLGLAIVKNLVDLLGGSIEVESILGRGSTFTVRVECDTVPARNIDDVSEFTDDPPSCDLALKGMHVLLCEDHPLNQEIARALLRDRGIKVEIADNGQAGIEMFERSEPGHYGAILMDVRMPVMDGYQATRAIRAMTRADGTTVPIVAMTADAFEEDITRCLDAGMDDHIAKPVDPQRLYQVLKEACMGREKLHAER